MSGSDSKFSSSPSACGSKSALIIGGFLRVQQWYSLYPYYDGGSHRRCNDLARGNIQFILEISTFILLKDLSWTQKPESALGFEWASSIRGEIYWSSNLPRSSWSSMDLRSRGIALFNVLIHEWRYFGLLLNSEFGARLNCWNCFTDLVGLVAVVTPNCNGVLVISGIDNRFVV